MVKTTGLSIWYTGLSICQDRCMWERSGYELPLLLLGAFRALIEDLHIELAQRGHAQARPVHGFALQAIGTDSVTVSELGRRLGVSKQAAGKTAASLEDAGYVFRDLHPKDSRAWVLTRTPLGTDMLQVSAEIFDQLREVWVETLGPEQLESLESALARMSRSNTAASLADLPGFLG